MIATLRESKAKLSALVALAQAGEDVIITVRGKPKAKLSAIRAEVKTSMSGWKKELELLHRQCRTKKRTVGSQSIIDKVREERF